ncbi:hypothetical protein HZA97_01135 [Candidatus Woesearchaeota archaeon]|nr:hypothetical protein [Candidatus Woesearchaeota archaeon]
MNQNILGEKKKSSFDESLADKVNQIFDKMPEIKKEKKDKVGASILRSDIYAQNTVEEWIVLYKQKIANNLVFASMPDVYRTFKTFKKWLEDKSMKHTQNIETAVDELKRTFTQGNQLLTSTKLEYYSPKHSSPECKIIHYADFGSLKKTKAIIHVERASLWRYAQNQRGQEFLQTLFGTEDSMKEIMDVWEWIGTCKPSQIFVRTPFGADIDSPEMGYTLQRPLVAYASLKVDPESAYLPGNPALVINLETGLNENGCARSVMRK